MYTASGKEYVLKGPGDYVVKDIEIASSSGIPPVTRATEWRTSGAVSIRQADAARAIGTIDPVSLIAHAPRSSARWPVA